MKETIYNVETGETTEREIVDEELTKILKQQELDEKLNRISELKGYLYDTDYKAIKYAEGELTAEEYAPIKEQRRQWRAEINRLEEGK